MFVFAAATALGIVPACHAQCSQLHAVQVQCGGPNNCQQTVAVNLPLSAEYGFTLTPQYTYCCDGVVEGEDIAGNCESPGNEYRKIYEPMRKDQLSQLAAKQQILIANCGGGYDPYMARPEKPFSIDSALLVHHDLKLN